MGGPSGAPFRVAQVAFYSSLSKKGKAMNKDIIEGKWAQLKGSVRSQWGRITEDEVSQIKGESARP